MNVEDMQGTINLILAVIGGLGGTILGIIMLYNKLKVMLIAVKNSSTILEKTNNEAKISNELFNKAIETLKEENDKTINVLKEEKEYYQKTALELTNRMIVTQEAIKLAFTNDNKLVSNGIAREIAKLYEKDVDIENDL